MRKMLQIILAVIMVLMLSACLAPKGGTPDQIRGTVQLMHDETLAQLYQQRATSEDVINKAAGYAVFSNVNGQFFFLGGGGGYGVAVNQTTKQKTYMRMAQAGLGLGLGIQDIRVIFVFHSTRALDDFLYRGWEFGGQADVTAKAREKGGAFTGELSIDAETSMYTMSESGLIAKVNLSGTKYWQDVTLN